MANPTSVTNYINSFESFFGKSIPWKKREEYIGFHSDCLRKEAIDLLNEGISWWKYKSSSFLEIHDQKVYIITVLVNPCDFVSPLLSNEPQRLDLLLKRMIDNSSNITFKSISFKYENKKKEGCHELLMALAYNK